MTTNAFITKTYNDTTVLTFRNDGWFNMTKAAKAFGKDVREYMGNKSTKEFIAVLADIEGNSPQYVETAVGRNGGTWAHPDLAVEFARWLDPRFSVWCSKVIKDILTGAAQVNIVKPEQSEILKMPTSMLEAAEQWLMELRRSEALKLENAKQAEVIAEQAPKADFYDALSDASTTFTPTDLANMLQMPEYKSGKKVNELLKEMGLQYKRGKHWFASSLATECGYLITKVFMNEGTGLGGSRVRITIEGVAHIRRYLGSNNSSH